mmetsp:Transcript_36499/g.54599  ORF Transcript_36499/g.54599 Transcript_36499/m.54599 type:complete len:104 (+) Transcript_36499:391-702(+)
MALATLLALQSLGREHDRGGSGYPSLIKRHGPSHQTMKAIGARPRERIEWHAYTALMATEPQCSFFIFVSPLPRFRQYLLKRNCAKRMKYEAYIPSAAVKFGM